MQAVQIGTVIAHDRKAAQRWKARKRPGKNSAALTGRALERAIQALAMQNPEYVVMGA